MHFAREVNEIVDYRRGQMRIKTPITKRNLIIPWKIHPETKLNYIPIKSFKYPSDSTNKNKSNKWKTVQPLVANNNITNKTTKRIKTSKENPVITRNRFSPLARKEEVSNERHFEEM